MNFETVKLNGGWELGWPAGAEVVPVGGHGLPRVMTVKHPGVESQPALAMEIQIWDGVPVCAKVELDGKKDTGAQVRPKNLKELADIIDSLIEMASERFAFTRNGQTGWGRANPGTLDDQRARLRSVRGARRKISPAFLERVAETYRNADTPKLAAVSNAFECSERSAARYVTAARGAGLLDG